MKKTWDIFCAVVDNYGDLGVCWRLARQLAMERGMPVRLWVDDLTPLRQLVPAASDADPQRLEGVEVRHWHVDFPSVEPADVVIEAFACTLPEAYLAAMAARPRAPRWINLEYLSAEAWIDDCHGLASPQPPLSKHFFFPGFSARSGGLLREQDYAARRQAFNAAAFCAALGIRPRTDEELTVSLFAYENSGVGELLDAWAAGPRPIRCLLPEGRLLPAVRAWAGEASRRSVQRGALTVQVLPFLAQTDYDALLWLADLNFVRGEDSFVRAQWAAKPFVWHIYPQQEDHHRVKLAAFLDRYLAALPAPTALAARDFALAWEQGSGLAAAWPAFAEELPALTRHGPVWAEKLLQNGDLAAHLLTFCAE